MRKPTTLTAAATVLLAALTSCGGSSNAAAPSATPSPSTPPISADTCRAVDTALTSLTPLVDGEGAPALVAQTGPDAAAQLRRAAQLTTGQARTAVEQAALRIELLVDKENSWTLADAEFDDGPEVAAVREAIVAVDKLCREAGASLSHVPAPE